MLSSSILAGTVFGYGRRAYAACVSVGGSNFICSGASTGQSISAANANVSTLPGFSVTTVSANALAITGSGDIFYTDTNFSPLTATSGNGLNVSNAAGPGSITINTNGAITARNYGIRGRNFGTGALSITANGDITSTGTGTTSLSRGIVAINSGTDLSVTTGPGTTVSGLRYGILSRNYGTGTTTVTVNGDVTASGTTGTDVGILARGNADVTVTTATGTAVSGQEIGITARSDGGGAVTITVDGDVTGNTGNGIYARTGAGGSIAINVGAASSVTSNGTGFAIDTSSLAPASGATNLTVAGTLNGGTAGAVRFHQGLALDDRLELHPTASINGTVFAGPGTDTLALDGSGTGSFDVSQIGPAAQYRDFENFEKVGASQWTLNGTNAGIAAWTVSAGLLSVEASMANTAFTVNAGTLGGTGTIGSVSVAGGATVAPGNAGIGTLNATGTASFASGSFYRVEINAAGASDKLITAGSTTINGGTVQVIPQPGTYTNTTYTILTAAGGVTGTFANLDFGSAFLCACLSYDANNVYLTITPTGLTFAGVGQTPNQIATGAAVEQLGRGNPIYDVIVLSNAAQARAAFDQLSGEVHASAVGVMLDDSHHVRDALVGRLRQTYGGDAGPLAAIPAASTTLAYGSEESAASFGFGTKRPPAASKERVATWGQMIGAWGHTASDGNAAALARSVAGVISGIDATFDEKWRAGLAGGYTRSSLHVGNRRSAGTLDNYHFGFYGGAQLGAFGLRTGVAQTWHDVRINRSISFSAGEACCASSFSDSVKTDYRARTVQAFGEIGADLSAHGIAIEPFVNAAYVGVHTDGFTEAGGAAALVVSANNIDVVYSTVGVRTATILQAFEMALTPRVSAAWQHGFGNVKPDASLAFASTGAGFIVGGVPVAKDSLLIESGLDVALSPAAKLGLFYSGRFSSGAADNALNGRFTWSF